MELNYFLHITKRPEPGGISSKTSVFDYSSIRISQTIMALQKRIFNQTEPLVTPVSLLRPVFSSRLLKLLRVQRSLDLMIYRLVFQPLLNRDKYRLKSHMDVT